MRPLEIVLVSGYLDQALSHAGFGWHAFFFQIANDW